MAITVFSVGMLLNSTILRCYWKEKTSMSAYYRAFSVIDMFLLTVMIIRQICVSFWSTKRMFSIFGTINSCMISVYTFCPLVLAMDRCLIVSFPHNFVEYGRKLRVLKGLMLLVFAILALTSSMVSITEETAAAVLFHQALLIATSVLQIVAIVVLYGIIIVKVLRSDRQMKTSRHIGNQ